MEICVLGAGGMLGTDLLDALGPDRGAGFTRAQLDVTDAAAVRRALDRARPRIVVNCAAYTKVDDCETQQEAAYAVNRDGAGHVAAAAAAVDARFIHLSTDYVFDGSATAPIPVDATPNPAGVYGASKLAGEEAVRQQHPGATIVRTAWLYGLHGPNFIESILRAAGERDRLTVVDDQRGAPTSTRDLAQAIVNLLQVDATGVVHVANAGTCTWCGFARFILDRAGVTGVEVASITTADLNRPAPRPAYSVLDCSRYADLTGAPLRPWEDAAGDYLRLRRQAGEGACS